MTVNEFLTIITKDDQAAEYSQGITIKTYAKVDPSPDGDIQRLLAHGKAYELLELNNIENVVNNLQEFTVIEIRRIPKGCLEASSCPYLLLVA